MTPDYPKGQVLLEDLDTDTPNWMRTDTGRRLIYLRTSDAGVEVLLVLEADFDVGHADAAATIDELFGLWEWNSTSQVKIQHRRCSLLIL